MFFISVLKFFKRSFILASLSLMLMNANLLAATAPLASLTLAWTPPTKRIDGSAFKLEEFGYYTLHVISQPDGLYSNKIIDDPYQLQLVVDNVERNKTYYFSVEITDRLGNSSGLSSRTVVKL